MIARKALERGGFKGEGGKINSALIAVPKVRFLRFLPMTYQRGKTRVNVIMFWMSATERGLRSANWMTFSCGWLPQRATSEVVRFENQLIE